MRREDIPAASCAVCFALGERCGTGKDKGLSSCRIELVRSGNISLMEFVRGMRVSTPIAVALIVLAGFGPLARPSPEGHLSRVQQPLARGASPETIHFRDVSTRVGLTTVPHSSSIRRYIVETMGGGGVALFDCDNDGKLDIAVVNDSTIDRYLGGGDPMVTLYHQDTKSGKLHFTDITQSAGLTTRGLGNGIAVADFDNDGLPDLYVTG